MMRTIIREHQCAILRLRRPIRLPSSTTRNRTILNTSFPRLSAILLGRTGNEERNDGFITAGEWPAFNVKSDLLVMSACETGLGKIVSGEGVQGLPYSL